MEVQESTKTTVPSLKSLKEIGYKEGIEGKPRYHWHPKMQDDELEDAYNLGYDKGVTERRRLYKTTHRLGGAPDRSLRVGYYPNL